MERENKVRVLEYLMRTYPNGLTDQGWNYEALSDNEFLSTDFVRDNFDKDWDFPALLSNTSVDIEVRIELLNWIMENADNEGGDEYYSELERIEYSVKDLQIIEILDDNCKQFSVKNLADNEYLELEAIKELYLNY